MLKLACLLVLLTGTRALIVCPENACATADCAAVEECNGKVSVGGGWCGCCDICVTDLAEGDSCMATLLLGVPSTVQCADGLYCDADSGKCKSTASLAEASDEEELGPCLKRKQEIELARQNELPLIGVSEPVCDADGYYSPVQCIGSVCHCVDRMGTDIEGYSSEIGQIANMDCQCAIDQAEYMKTGLIGKLFFCADNGNYKTTGASVAMTTEKPMVSASNLLTGTGTQTMTNGACAKELEGAQSSGLLGAFVPECDADGNYVPRQCQGSECYCVRKDGTKIEGYSAPIATKDHVTCQCARDKDTYESMGIIGRIYTCRQNGNYQQYQCVGSVCHCTDDMGNMVGEQTVSIGDINNLNCP